MIPLVKGSSLLKDFISEFHKEPYLKINVILAGVIMMIFIYSGIFSPEKNNYPVVCFHEKITGEPCASCGLSHSFSLIELGRITEAYTWNPYGMRIFLFFLGRLLMRVVYSAYFFVYRGNRKQLIALDISGSVIMFLFSFWPLLRQLALSL